MRASRSSIQRNAARVLPDPVGAWIRVWCPLAMAFHPDSCAAVGAGKDARNQAVVAG